MSNNTEALIAEMKAAAEKATPGEWIAFADEKTGTCAIHTPSDKGCGDIVDWPGFDSSRVSKKKRIANAKHIALSNPKNIKALIAALEKSEAIRVAAENLVRCKGRYHSEQNYRALAALFGVTTPDLPPLAGEASPLAPQLPAVPDGWSESAITNAITVMLDRIETIDPADDDRIEEVKRLVLQLTSADGWVVVPVELTPRMITKLQQNTEIGSYIAANWAGAYGLFQKFWDEAIAAAPKPEV
ncbi:ead/Ea22-like family protein [Enterobacter sp. TMH.L2]